VFDFGLILIFVVDDDYNNSVNKLGGEHIIF